MKIVKKGDTVKVEYIGSLEDGTVFDSSEKHEAPLEFIVGSGQIIPGFEEAVVGMKVGEEKQITLEPEEAYGDYNPDLVKKIPKDCFPEDQDVQQGMIYMMNIPDGRQVPVKITDVEEDAITIDLNPPLAGRTLIFKIKIVAIVE
jgi:FKBP-type peptidyl-prolyl cis-trans isomerase 2